VSKENSAQPPSAADLKRALTQGSHALNEKASALSDRIRRLQEFLSKLPGRVETHLTIGRWDGIADLHLVVRFHRTGRHWIFSYDFYHEHHPDEDSNWRQLVDAPLEVKIAVVNKLPELLSEMLSSQQTMIHLLDSAHETLNTLAAEFGLDEKEGE